MQVDTGGQARRSGLLWRAVIFIVLINAGGAVIGGAFGPEPGGWYFQLNRPFFTPPPWVFPVAWTTLYAMMAIALALVLEQAAGPARRLAVGLFVLQLMLNYAWSIVFFGLQALGAASLLTIALLLAVVGAAGAMGRVDRRAGWLMAPYVAWVAFALLLTVEIWRANPA